MNKNNTVKIIVSIGLVVMLIGVSYAFHSINLDVNNEHEVGATSANLTLTYTDCAKNEDCSNISASLIPGAEVSKTFKVENTGSINATYGLHFKELVNTFKNDELVYTIKRVDTGEVITTETPVPYQETISSNIFLKNLTIPVGETHSFILTVKFLNTDYGQDENASSTFSFKLGIDEAN